MCPLPEPKGQMRPELSMCQLHEGWSKGTIQTPGTLQDTVLIYMFYHLVCACWNDYEAAA